MIGVIASREWKSLFLSLLAWSVLGVIQLILAWIFLAQIDTFLQVQSRLAGMEGAPGLTDLIATPLFGAAVTFLMLLTPLLTMRLISDELRNGTFSLLLTAPVSMTQIVLGKYLGFMGFIAVSLGLTLLMPLSLLIGGSLDFGKLAAALLGLFLATASFAAVGLFISSLTAQPAIAAIGTYGVLLFFWIINLAAETGEQSGRLFNWLSLQSHYEFMMRGLIRTSDLIYYLLLIAAFLLLTIRRLDNRRRED
ncbi:MAG: ABC transporter permease [Gammaproteobacteria bacterium RIFOXYA12_FULL_61_12]|nr:MAG: ABC transporter permease [Gammaproteobacteria bacterium RIFOXYA12_FULL_61_12]